jgi:hypothetical protein
MYLLRRNPGVLFLCDFGCAVWALLDSRHPQGQMWWWQVGNRHKLDLTFPAWLTAWLCGRGRNHNALSRAPCGYQIRARDLASRAKPTSKITCGRHALRASAE